MRRASTAQIQADKQRHKVWGEAALDQHSQYMGHSALAGLLAGDCFEGLESWPEPNKTAMFLRGLTRCDQPQHLEAEEQLHDFATHYAALRG